MARNAARRERAALKERARAHRTKYAAVEAAEENPSYSPDAIEQSVAEIVALAVGLWRDDTVEGLGDRPDGDVVRAWARWWKPRLGSGLEAGKPSVDLLRVVNRDDEAEDRVVVRVRVRVHCKHPNVGILATRHVQIDER